MAWRLNLGLAPQPDEVRALIQLGQCWLKAMSEGGSKAADKTDADDKPAKSKAKPARRPREKGR